MEACRSVWFAGDGSVKEPKGQHRVLNDGVEECRLGYKLCILKVPLIWLLRSC